MPLRNCPACIRPVFLGGIRMAFRHVIERSDALRRKDRLTLDLIDVAVSPTACFWMALSTSRVFLAPPFLKPSPFEIVLSM